MTWLADTVISEVKPKRFFSPDSDDILLSAISERCRRIGEITSRITEKEFLDNFVVQDAVIQALEVIGEASGKLSNEFRTKNADIPFRQMKELRNVLIHQFDSIDIKRVWVIARKSVPKFCAQIKTIS